MVAKSENTKILLISALERILSGQTKLTSPNRRLSIKAVEEEANLGDGTAYYYPEIVNLIKEKITQSKADGKTISDDKPEIEKLKERLNKERKIKEKYYQQIIELKALLSNITANQNALVIENKQLREQLEISHSATTLTTIG